MDSSPQTRISYFVIWKCRQIQLKYVFLAVKIAALPEPKSCPVLPIYSSLSGTRNVSPRCCDKRTLHQHLSFARTKLRLLLQVFTFSGTVPIHLPPSYRGSYIKYSYLVLVGLQRVNRPVSLISLPIRIINLPGKLAAITSRGVPAISNIMRARDLETSPMRQVFLFDAIAEEWRQSGTM